MLGKILGSGQLGKLASFVSPTFFDVMPARALFRRAKQLYGDSRNDAVFQRAQSARSQTLAAAMPELQLAGAAPSRDQRQPSGVSAEDTARRAGQIVELYFHQLFQPGPTLLDLRAVSFSLAPSGLVWHPAAWVADWSADFIQPLREIYRGFYQHDDAQFRRGLGALSLTHSEDLFRAQFGADQARVTFRTQEFIDIFHQVFTRCKHAGTKLHPDFLALGIYLAALYDHEQELGVSVNVAEAFARATDPRALNPASDPEATHA